MVNPKHLEIVEYLNLSYKNLSQDALSLYGDMKDSQRTPSLKALIDATHSGRLTNLRVYPGKHVKDSVDSFLKPNGKPVLKHHNDELDPIGRVMTAEYVQIKHGKEFDFDYVDPSTDMGSGFIRLGVNITDQDSIEKFIDGRFKNVSTRQSSDYMLCSICGDNFLDDASECKHVPGHSYEVQSKDKSTTGKYKCYVITGPLKYKEVSVVNIPGDEFAEIKSVAMDTENSINISSYDKTTASIGSLVLTDGENEVSLMPTIGKSQVTARDRAKLTGKTIVAVSPTFDSSILSSLANEETSMTETKTETKNTTIITASDSGSTAEAGSKTDSKEGVVAPEKSSELTKLAVPGGLSDAASIVAIEALTTSLNAAKADALEAKAEVERLKATVKQKDEEIDLARKNNASMVADLKMSYSNSLLNTQVLLKKPVTALVIDQESFDKKLTEYAERSVDSLKDSLKDLGPELVALKEGLGIKKIADMVADTKVTNPVANSNATIEDDNKTESAEPTKSKALENYFG